jgi:hypothetical protein
MSFSIAAGVVAVAGVGLSVYGASQQASGQKKAARYQTEAGGRQQAQSEWEAEQIWKQAEDQARQIRAKAIQMRGQQVASMAASGILIGDGSSQALLDETTNLAELDAMATLYNGARGVLAKEEEGRLARQDAVFQSQQLYKQANYGMIGALGSAMSTLGSVGGSMASKFSSQPIKGGGTTNGINMDNRSLKNIKL